MHPQLSELAINLKVVRREWIVLQVLEAFVRRAKHAWAKFLRSGRDRHEENNDKEERD
jgi:hypothetical protein